MFKFKVGRGYFRKLGVKGLNSLLYYRKSPGAVHYICNWGEKTCLPQKLTAGKTCYSDLKLSVLGNGQSGSVDRTSTL